MVSFTVTVKLQLDVFVEPSVAVQVTVVSPLLKVTPFNEVPVPVVTPLRLYAKVTVVQLSEPVASRLVFGDTQVQPVVILRVWLLVQLIIGLMVSFTVTVKLQLDVFVEPSVAVQVTVVNPLLKLTPLRDVPVPVVCPLKL